MFRHLNRYNKYGILSGFRLPQRFSSSLKDAVDLQPKPVEGVVIKSKTATVDGKSLISPEKLANLTPAFITSDAPEEFVTKRTVRVYRPAKNAMQSGLNETKYWQIDFDPEQKWTNPVIGYTSSADSVQALRVRFHTKEQAICFAEKQGWNYVVQEDSTPLFRKKSYADNYKYSPGKLRLIKTK